MICVRELGYTVLLQSLSARQDDFLVITPLNHPLELFARDPTRPFFSHPRNHRQEGTALGHSELCFETPRKEPELMGVYADDSLR